MATLSIRPVIICLLTGGQIVLSVAAAAAGLSEQFNLLNDGLLGL